MLLFTHHYLETYKPKFYCRRHSGMNFGHVTENGVNSNVASPLCQNLRQKSAVFKISCGIYLSFSRTASIFLTIISSKQEKNCVLIFLF